ncbi:MAG: hypothetical protein U9Q69_02690, partial [Nanoarchaeota archaeon]|nr:hypothetical protein [Nanoarchaeota archaeon]
ADGVVEVPILENQADDKSQNQEDNQWQKFPKDVQNSIKEKGKLYGNRDKLHRKLKKLPSDNEKPTMKKRALIVAEMDAMTQKMEFLRETIKAFEDDKSLTKFQNKMAKERASKGERKLDDMKDIELVKARNNARAYITNRTKRIKNMPDGPKKQKFELKLKDKKAVLLEIEILIKKREK